MGRNQGRKGGLKRARAEEWTADMRDPSSLQNAAFERYYKGNVVPEAEWGAFMQALRTSLPVSLRVNQTLTCADAVRDLLRARLSAEFATHELPFFPNGALLQSTTSRGDLKRTRELRPLKRLISALNEGGYVTRQETVSTLPPLLLQVQPGQRVLDLCAAPGSKTSQLLEALLPLPSAGVLVANDLNASRLDVLHHQTNRLPGAHSHLIITNYDATRFPLLPPEHCFDRVLCDVMCSGDGTLRKSIDMWPRWSTTQGADLHRTQCAVLRRGMALCKAGGLVVYSTCSLNPIEDEAVVSACLASAPGCFELIDPDAAGLLPGLISSPGLTNWCVATADETVTLHNFAEAQAYLSMPDKRAKGFRYHASMFADTALLEVQNISFTRRILPHQQDTGGFFVALLRCVRPPSGAEEPARASVGTTPPLRVISPELQVTVRRALGLPIDFPTDHLLVRSESAREQKIYYANDDVIALSARLGSRVVHVGSKIFEAFVKSSNEALRLTAEGVAGVAPLLPAWFCVSVDAETVLVLAHEAAMSYDEFARRTGHTAAELPPCASFVLRCDLALVGPLFIAAERSVRMGKLLARVAEWQVTLCRHALHLPLVEIAAETCNAVRDGDVTARVTTEAGRCALVDRLSEHELT